MEEDNTIDPVEPQEPTAAEPADPADELAEPAPAEPQEPADPAAEPPKENKVQKRIDEITRARRQAEQEAEQSRAQAEYWRKVATGEIQQPAPQQRQPDVVPGLPARPVVEAFEDYDDYVVALGEWSAEKTLATREYKARQAEEQKTQAMVLDNHHARVEAVKGTKYPDWDEVVALAPGIRFNDNTLAAIIDSDQSADISYHLMKNHAEYQRVAALPPVQQIKEIARLEDKFKGSTQPVKRISQAPTPLNPLAGGADTNVQKDPSKMTDAEWIAWERERVRKQGRRY